MVAIDALPAEFVLQMRALLGDEASEFFDALSADRVRGVRANPAKVVPAEVGRLLGADLAPVPWCPTGFTAAPEAVLGGHIAHVAGLVYLQEPTAMSVAEVLAAPPGARVADLAAAPGGKTTQLSSLVGPDGLVLAVEVEGRRLGSLHESLDMWGAANVVTMCAPMQALALDLAEPFDFAILDAPCSGEALFRRDPRSMREWSPAIVRGCARRQQRMLASAAALLAPDGVLVYSTCTFGTAENEDQIAQLLAAQAGWELEAISVPAAEPGLASGLATTQLAARLWPHRVAGEGQFVARLRRTAGAWEPSSRRPEGRGRRRPADDQAAAVRAAWRVFRREWLTGWEPDPDRVVVRKDRAYLLPVQDSGVALSALARPGLPLGRSYSGRFEPSPALASSLRPEQAVQSVAWQLGDPRLDAYLSGAPVQDAGPDGWVLVCWERWPLAWARRRSGVLKNFLPGHSRTRVARARAKR